MKPVISLASIPPHCFSRPCTNENRHLIDLSYNSLTFFISPSHSRATFSSESQRTRFVPVKFRLSTRVVSRYFCLFMHHIWWPSMNIHIHDSDTYREICKIATEANSRSISIYSFHFHSLTMNLSPVSIKPSAPTASSRLLRPLLQTYKRVDSYLSVSLRLR